MQAKPMFYDGSGEKKQTTSAAEGTQASSIVITEEMRKSIGGNPYVFVK
ncbi:hypothetical protein LC048_20485 [Mesobacillus subterraneus]|nr:hypothetical protein [Mesobacillus subterraneus]WLR54755.1 hypothetical protein LC048_20485 [Mesobacillus subterraneus]